MYKRLIILIILVFVYANGWAETAQYGSQWKQIDTTLYPADDVTEVSFTGFSTSGLNGGVQLGDDVTFGTISGSALTVDEIHAYDIMLKGVFGSGTSLDVAGAGTRCFYYPKKAAWRCGRVSGTQWNDANVGNYSFAGGLDNTASGAYGTAFGNSNTASGSESTAIGQANTASGIYSAAIGSGNTASGNYSFVTNYQNIASGNQTFAAGFSAVAGPGQRAAALGDNPTASGNASFAQNLNTTASGANSTATGNATTASGTNSYTGGLATQATGAQSIAKGSYVRVSGTDSFIYGNYADATERDANILSRNNSFKLANTSLWVPFNNISSELSPYTVTTKNMSFDCDANAGAVTFNLISSSRVVGMGLEVTKVDSSANKCYLEGAGSETISGFTTYSGLDTQWESVIIRANTTRWTIKASY